MPNMVEYWKRVNEIASGFSANEVWLVSVENTDKGLHAGRVVLADKKTAAQRLVERTHVLADQSQIDAELVRQAADVRRHQGREDRRTPRPQISLMIGPEQLAALNSQGGSGATVEIPQAAQETTPRPRKSA